MIAGLNFTVVLLCRIMATVKMTLTEIENQTTVVEEEKQDIIYRGKKSNTCE